MGKKMNAAVDENEVLDSSDYARNRYSAGKLDENGVTFVFIKMDEVEGEFGQFYRIFGTTDEASGDEVIIDFSSTSLHKLISKNFDKLYGRKVNLAGYGEKFERHYKLRFVN